ARLRVLVPRLGHVEGRLESRKLAAQRSDLLIEQLDLGQCAGGDPLLGFDLAVERADLALRRVRAAAQALVKPLDAVALALRAGKAGAQLGDRLLQGRLAG